MYIHSSETEEVIISKDTEEKIESSSSKKKTKRNLVEHNKWNNYRENKKRPDFDKMPYWQVVSHCSIL